MQTDLSYMRPLKSAVLSESQNNIRLRDCSNATSYIHGKILPRRLPDHVVAHGRDRFGKGGVIDSKGHYVDSSAITGWFMSKYDCSDCLFIDKTVVYCGYIVRHWGHFLLETVTRLWYFLEHDRPDYLYAFVVNCGADTSISGNIKEFFDLLGILDRIVVLNEPTEFQEVIVPDRSFEYSDFYSPLYTRIFDQVCNNALMRKQDTGCCKKIYLSRGKFEKALDTESGLDMLDNYFSKNGYEIVYPEEVHLTDLIVKLRNAEECAAESGTVAHNFLFCCDNQSVIIVERQMLVNDAQASIDYVRSLHTTYIDGHLTIYPVMPGSGPYFLYYTRQFADFTANRKYSPPDAKYVSDKYLRNCLKKYLAVYRRDHYLTVSSISEYAKFADVQYEAYEDSLGVLGIYLRGEKTYSLHQFLDLVYIKRRIKKRKVK